MRQFIIPILLFAIVATGLLSCRKSQLNKDTSAAEDNALALSLWDDVGKQVEGSSTSHEAGGPGTNKWNNCATMTLDSTSSEYPLTVTLDFGDEGCEGIDGRIRRGKLIYTISGPYTETGTIISVTSNDYYVNDYRIEGIRTVENQGPDSHGHIQFSVSVTDAIITDPDQKTITWESEFTRSWTEGSETGFLTKKDDGTIMGIDGLLDDVYEITGTGSGTNRNGLSFNLETEEPLRMEFACRWIAAGKTKLTLDDLEPRILDYGSGACDNEAIVTIGHKKHAVYLRG